MEVRLLDGSTHEVDTNDVALLSQHIEIRIPCIYSNDIFRRFKRFLIMHQHEEDPKLTEEWDNMFSEEIVDTDTLFDLIMLASNTGQGQLMDVCCKRAADMLKKRLSADVVELLNLPNDDEEEEEEENLLPPEVPGDNGDG